MAEALVCAAPDCGYETPRLKEEIMMLLLTKHNTLTHTASAPPAFLPRPSATPTQAKHRKQLRFRSTVGKLVVDPGFGPNNSKEVYLSADRNFKLAPVKTSKVPHKCSMNRSDNSANLFPLSDSPPIYCISI